MSLCIAEKVEEERYLGYHYFDLSNQESAGCRVQLKCDGPSTKQKAARVAEAWRGIYPTDYYYTNEHKCAYIFEVV